MRISQTFASPGAVSFWAKYFIDLVNRASGLSGWVSGKEYEEIYDLLETGDITDAYTAVRKTAEIINSADDHGGPTIQFALLENVYFQTSGKPSGLFLRWDGFFTEGRYAEIRTSHRKVTVTYETGTDSVCSGFLRMPQTMQMIDSDNKE